MLRKYLSQLCAAGVLTSAFAGTALAQSYPVTPYFVNSLGVAAANPAAAPIGSDLPNCHSSVDAYPVVLVNGTFNVMETAFGALAPDLANSGYCVYTFNYGGAEPYYLLQATGPVAISAVQLAAAVAAVKQITGASKVDLVGYSQGGMLAEYYAKVLGGAANVHSLVGIGPSTHGTTLDGIVNLGYLFPGGNQLVAQFCPACADQEVGSAVINTLDAGPIAQPGVNYTVIDTKWETVVTPVGSSFIQEPGVTNEYIQSYCPYDPVDHQDLPFDNVVIQLVKNALTPAKATAPNCSIEYPFPAL